MKHKWTKGQVIAIRKSIKHWEKNVKKLKTWDKKEKIILTHCGKFWIPMDYMHGCDFDGNHCELCKKYGHRMNLYDNCTECPLYIVGQSCSEDGSIWRKCKDAIGNKAIIKSAENMLKVLVGLLK